MRRARLAAALLCAYVASPAVGEPPVRNGFRLEPSAVPAEQIREGGPGRDEIVALDAPKTLDAAASPWDPEAPVVGVAIGGQSRAYPLAVLEWHEVANDTLGGVDIAVTYSPLSGTALVFDRRQDGETLRFGVSGLLYQSNLLLYDRQSESLWSQIAARALTGKRMGARLRLLRSRIEPWSAWRERHPGTTALSPETGHRRPYGASPFGDYALSERVLFPDPAPDPRYHPKMPTLGLRVADGTARGYPAEELARAGGRVQETFAGRQVRVAYDAERQVFDIDAPDDVERVEGFWFAWAAFHPQASVFTGPPPAAP